MGISTHSRGSRTRAFISWTPHPRANAIADAIAAELYNPTPGKRNWPAPLRYTIQSVATAIYVNRVRPSDIFFTNPPAVAGLAMVPLARLVGARVWSDSHSGAFNDPRWMRFARLNNWVMRHCAGVIVTNRPLAELVRASGGRPFVVNLVASRPQPRRAGLRQTIVAPLSYRFDEPVEELLQAAAMAPEVHLTITGRAPEWVVQRAPDNCTLTGWLSRSDYDALLSQASGMACLTSRELTAQMGAFEAIEHGIPILASGTAVLRAYLDQGGVIFVDDHDPDTLAIALEAMWHERERLMSDALAAQGPMFKRANQEITDLRVALDSGDRTSGADD
jgi:glycosyltransferase involved in cell wall biosynthesis